MPDSNLPPDGLTSSELASIGDALLFFGVASSLLNLVDRQFCLLSWMDLWGPAAGWAIRFSIAAAGLACRWTAFRRNRAERKDHSGSSGNPFDQQIAPGSAPPPRSDEA